MARKQRQQPIPRREPSVPPAPPAPLQIQLGYDPQGPKQAVDIVSSKDAWSEFTLADGTILRAKTVILDVKKMVDQYNPDGEPIYEMQLTMVSQVRAPQELKKKG